MNKESTNEAIGYFDMALYFASLFLLLSVIFYFSEQISSNFTKMLWIGGFWSLILLVRLWLSTEKEFEQ